jgi:hypothetical protein
VDEVDPHIALRRLIEDDVYGPEGILGVTAGADDGVDRDGAVDDPWYRLGEYVSDNVSHNLRCGSIGVVCSPRIYEIGFLRSWKTRREVAGISEHSQDRPQQIARDARDIDDEAALA